MISTTKTKVVIALSHPCPDEFVKDLKQSVLLTIQAQDPQAVNKEELQEANTTLLELLRALI